MMANVNPTTTFTCPTCNHAAHISSGCEGANSQQLQTQNRLTRPCHRKSMLQGVAISLVFHVALLSALAAIFFNPREIDPSVILALLPESEEVETEFAESPGEIPGPILMDVDANEIVDIASGEALDLPVDGQIMPELAKRRDRADRLTPFVDTIDSVSPLTRFSPIAADRLNRHPAAKAGDYEIALFWDGPSDLDLHVHYRSPSNRTRRDINYRDKGNPETGFLDVDQNFRTNYVDDPIEHIRWNTKRPPPGVYRIFVHGFHLRSNDGLAPSVVRFTVELKTPDGVRSFSGAVGEKQSWEIDALTIGGTVEQSRALAKAQTAAKGLLGSAKNKLQEGTSSSRQEATGTLKGLIRRFPKSSEASEARELLNSTR